MRRITESDSLKFKNISAEEKTRRGILGRLYGPVASFANPTRNGRHYSQKLWEQVFNSDLVKERFANGGIFGELCHPADREEVEMDRVAIVMPEPPVKDSNGNLIAYVDIIDTPAGKIAYQLAKYGYKFGISTRGTGDIIEGVDGDEVDPETYQLNALDLVEIPAVESARLQFVESLNTTKRYGKTLKESLQKVIDKASKEDRKIMTESLKELGLNEGWYDFEEITADYLNKQNRRWDYPELYDALKAHAVVVILDKTIDSIYCDEWYPEKMIKKGLDPETVKSELYQFAKDYDLLGDAGIEGINEGLNESKGEYISIDDVDEDKYPYLYDALNCEAVSLVVYDNIINNESFDTELMEENAIDEIAVKDDIERYAEHRGLEFQFDADYAEGLEEASNGSVEYYLNKMKSGNPEKVYKQAKGNPNAEKAYKQLKGLGEELDISTDNSNAKYYDGRLYSLYGDLEELVREVANDPDLGTESYIYKTLEKMFNELDDHSQLIDEGAYTRDELMKKFGTDNLDLINAGNEEDVTLKDDVDEAFDPRGITRVYDAINDGVETDEDKEALVNYLNQIVGYCYDMADSFDVEINPHYFSDMNESIEDGSDIEDKEVVDDKSAELVAELQEALNRVKQLETDNLSLQEKLSVGITKETGLSEQLAKYKQATARLSKSMVKAKTLTKELNESKKNLAESKKITERLSRSELSARMALGETDKKIDEYKVKNEALTESVDDLTSKLEAANNKLAKSSELIAKYKKSYSALKESYLELKVRNYGLNKDEVKQRLGESYKIHEIDTICEELNQTKRNLNKLPFRLNENTRIGIKGEVKSGLISNNTDDYVSESLLNMLN